MVEQEYSLFIYLPTVYLICLFSSGSFEWHMRCNVPSPMGLAGVGFSVPMAMGLYAQSDPQRQWITPLKYTPPDPWTLLSSMEEHSQLEIQGRLSLHFIQLRLSHVCFTWKHRGSMGINIRSCMWKNSVGFCFSDWCRNVAGLWIERIKRYVLHFYPEN